MKDINKFDIVGFNVKYLDRYWASIIKENKPRLTKNGTVYYLMEDHLKIIDDLGDLFMDIVNDTPWDCSYRFDLGEKYVMDEEKTFKSFHKEINEVLNFFNLKVNCYFTIDPHPYGSEFDPHFHYNGGRGEYKLELQRENRLKKILDKI